MRRIPAKAILLALLAGTVAGGVVCSGAAPVRRSEPGVLNGRVGLATANGAVVPVQSGTVFVLYDSGMKWNSLQWGTFTHARDLNTAGGQFISQFNRLIARDKELKSLTKAAKKEEKRSKNNPSQRSNPKLANQIAARYLQDLEQALQSVRAWQSKHPDRLWQMQTVAPDSQGFWSMPGLPPGSYEIVVRGSLPGYDADWEASVDLAPGKTISLPLLRPRFFRRL